MKRIFLNAILAISFIAAFSSCANTAPQKQKAPMATVSDSNTEKKISQPTLDKIADRKIEQPPLDKTYVAYADPMTETIIDVNCSDFESTFRDEKKKIELKLDTTLFNHYHWVKDQSIDVRLKITYWYAGKLEEACMDRYGNFFVKSKNKFATNKPLSKFLHKNVPGFADFFDH